MLSLSDILVILALPGLLLGLLTLFYTRITGTGGSGGGRGMDYMLWDLLRLGGYVGLSILGLAVVVAIIEHFKEIER